MFWRVGLRIIAWILFIAMLAATVIGTVYTIVEDEEPLLAVAIFFGGLIVSFLSVAMMMIFLNIAKDLSEIRQRICFPAQTGNGSYQNPHTPPPPYTDSQPWTPPAFSAGQPPPQDPVYTAPVIPPPADPVYPQNNGQETTP
jgi:hypothetical protein